MRIDLYSLVEIECKPLDSDPIRGFHLHSNRHFVALQHYDCGMFTLSGFTVVKRDVISRSKFIPSSDMVARIARAKRLRPSLPHGVSFGNWRSLLESASNTFPLLTIYRERIRRGKCLIGKPTKFNSQALWLYTVDRSAEWDDIVKVPYRDITRLDLGGEYERWLYRFCGPPKPPLD